MTYEEFIEETMEEVNKLPIGSKERLAALNELKILNDIKVQNDKLRYEREDKETLQFEEQERRFDNKVKERTEEKKRTTMEWIKIILDCGVKVLAVVAPTLISIWVTKLGLEFETTGHIVTSKFFERVFSKIQIKGF